MKKVMPFLVVGIIVVIVVSLFLSLGKSQQMVVMKSGNLNKQPLHVEIGKYQDSDCGMVIETIDYLSEVVSPKGNTYFFHDHGGFVHWLEDKSFKDEAVIWVMSRDTKKFIDAKKAYYSLNDTTPMGYGFGAYEKNQDGFISFEDMRLRMLRGETLNNPKIRKQILGE